MTTRRSQTTLENSPSPSTPEGPGLPVQAKLAAASTSFMFLYVYVDILVLFWKPGVIEGILAGTVWGFAIGQTPATIALTLMAIPIFMVVLSMTLPSRANRITNLVVASVQIPYAAFNAVGESWTYFYGLSIGLEVLILAFILRSAWTWPQRTASSATRAGRRTRGAPAQL
jgi:hypothetical protein